MKKATLNKVLASALAVAICVPMLLANPIAANAVSGNTVSGNSASSSASSSSSGSSSEEAATVSKDTVTIGGKAVKSTVGGIFTASAVNGTVVTTPAASVAAAAGLSQADIDAGTNVRFYVCDSINKEAKAALKSVAEAAGKNVAAYINVDLYTITKKGVVTAIRSTSEPVTMVFGLPSRISKAGNVSVMCIDTNGKAVVMEDKDTDPKTLTIDTNVFGVYAIVY